MDSYRIKLIILGILATCAAVYLGMAAATAQFEAIAWVLGSLVLVTCLLLGRKIWLLIPFLGAVDITLRIPGQPSTLMLAQILVLGFSCLLLLMRRLPFRLRITELEVWMALLALMVLQVYLRNPVGVSLFGSGTVGGKPYFIFALSLVSAVLLAGLTVTERDLKMVLRLSIIGSLINISVALLGKVFPSVAFWTGAAYRSAAVADYTDSGTSAYSSGAGRDLSLAVFGQKLGLWVCSFKPPLLAFFHPLWFFLIILSVVCVTFGGFRSGVMTLILTYFVGVCYRGGFTHVFLACLMGVAGIAALALVNSIHPLPPNVQRSLTFIPGTWEERYKQDAEGSTEWRVEVWKEAILTDRWIQNKLLGDGLGFSAKELAYQLNLNERGAGRIGVSGFDAHREAVLANGDYHSGPVSTVRTVGYVGLLVLLLFQIRLAVHAHRQIVRCKGTQWYSLALLIGIPLIWSPFYFVFIFGDFRTASAALLLGAGTVRLLQTNLPLPPLQRVRVARPTAARSPTPVVANA